MKHINIALAALFCALLAASSATSIGVSPGSITLERMVRGGYGEKTIYLSNAGTDNLTLNIEADGELKNWLAFEPSGQITLLSKGAVPVTVKVSVPVNARNGLYTGNVMFSAVNLEKATGDASSARVMPGVIVRVSATVTGEEIYGYSIKSISVRDIEQNKPLEFVVTIENTGNVIARPNLTLSILDAERKELGRNLQHKESSVLPTVIREISIPMATKGLAVGSYHARITSDMGEEQMVFFHILEPGTLAIIGSLDQLNLNKIYVTPDETVIIEGQFTNDGESQIDKAKLMGESYLLDPSSGTKELIGVFESDLMTVPLGGQTVLTAYFTPKKAGQYSIEGFVVYSGKKSETKTTVLNVLANPQKNTPYSYYIAAGMLVLIMIAAIARSRKPARRSVPSPAGQDAGAYQQSGKRMEAFPEWVYTKLKSEMSDIKDTSILFVSMESQQHTDAVSGLLKLLVTERGMSCLYISMSDPYDKSKAAMDRAGVDEKRVYFIDCISHMAGKVDNKTCNAVFIENPTSLEEVKLYIDKVMATLSAPKLIILDSLSSLLIYNNERTVEKFTHTLINKIRIEGAGGVIISIKQKESEALSKTLVPMCDKEITL
ncbi:MAG: ATPase domain-containing protein [Candidatus Altiarchaeota archaeon]|nr:ATPase domain-containing protein [Candidatus Altiarchaeota archaeon]